jgi:hypothetical protein
MPPPRRNWVRRTWDRLRGVPAHEAFWAQALARPAPHQRHDGQTSDARKAREEAP